MSRKRRSQPYQIRGVEALFGDDIALNEADEPQAVALSAIRLPFNQPRRYFDPQKLEQLTESVKKHGILEPLLVRPLSSSGSLTFTQPESSENSAKGSQQVVTYELVAGERRFRAATAAGLSEVPVVIRSFSDIEALEVSLMENLQREDLNPVEETEGILELLALSLEVSKEDIISLLNRVANAKKRGQDLTDNVIRQMEIIDNVFTSIGRISPESFRTNRIPLLNLPEDVLESLRRGELEYTKARSISKLKDEYSRQLLLTQAVQNQLSLNEIRAQVRQISAQISSQIAANATSQNGNLPYGSAASSLVEDSSALTLQEGTRLKKQFNRISTRLKQSTIWNNPKKQEQIDLLLRKLEDLLP